MIRAGLADAKMNQLEQTVLVSRYSPREFGKQQWKQLGEKIDSWRQELDGILQVLESSKAMIKE